MEPKQQQTRPAILEEFRRPQNINDLRAKVKQFEGRISELREAQKWVENKIAALKQGYSENRAAMREEILDGNGHDAAIRRLAIAEEIKEMERLLSEELDHATHPHKIEDYFIGQESQRRLAEQERQVKSGAWLNQGGRRY